MATLQCQSRLDILIGSMFSGKSSALLRKLSQFAEMGLQVLYINHGIDTRSDNDYSTHCKILQDSKLSIPTIKATNLTAISTDLYTNVDVIAIDEAQFFDENLITFVLTLVEKYQKYVLVAGLDGTYKRQPFGHILDLVPYADNVTKLHAYCKPCSGNKILKTALFTKYIGDKTDTIIVGGAEQYLPVCRSCYLQRDT